MRNVLLSLILLQTSCVAQAADWPMWRGDARRSGVASAALPDRLTPHWTRRLPPTLLAWPFEPRLHFDAQYEPIVLGKRLIVGSPNDGSVTAFDTDTGEMRWRFFSDGPVRFTPVAQGDRVFFGSDDGRMYCLSAADGQLVWKVRVASEDRAEHRHLGNGRLISYWPVRGGPVLADGKIYCAAGIWPTMGIFVAALEASDGKIVWRNDGLGSLEDVRVDHNILYPSGLSPEGHLAIEGDTLLVPNGRSLPALLDRRTGKLTRYIQGYRNGDSRVIVQFPYVFVGETGIMDLRTGREVGSRWNEEGVKSPDQWDPGKMHLFEGPFFPYKFLPGCTFRSVLAADALYDFTNGDIAAFDLKQVKRTVYEAKGYDPKKIKPERWDPLKLWSMNTGLDAKSTPESTLILAGRRLYGHAGGTLFAVDPSKSEGEARIAWKQPAQGKPGSLLAGDDRLFVVTREGVITCFGPGERPVVSHEGKAEELSNPTKEWHEKASAFLKEGAIREGTCLILGLGTGQLARALLRTDPHCRVIAIDANPEKIKSFREDMIKAGLYGVRAEAFAGDPLRFSMPPYGVSVLTSEDSQVVAKLLESSPKEVYECLRPYGGTLCLTLSAERHEQFERWASTVKLDAAKVERKNDFSMLRRVGALSESAPWTHQTGDAGRSYFSRDRLVRPPFAVLWYGDGDDHGFWRRRDHGGNSVKPQVVGGRAFALQLHSSLLFAYDVYTGRHLWKSPAPKYTHYVSLADGIYVAAGNQCQVLRPSDGQCVAKFPIELSNSRKVTVSDLRVSGQTILVSVVPVEERKADKLLLHGTTLVALDRKTGKQLWVREARDAFNNNSLALGGGTVYCIDSIPALKVTAAQRRNDALPPSKVLALDERTGKERWTQSLSYELTGINRLFIYYNYDDWLAYDESQQMVIAGRLDHTSGLKAADGTIAWRNPSLRGQPMMVRGKSFINQYGQTFDMETGRPQGKPIKLERGGCNYLVANEFCLLGRDRSVTYVDIASGVQQGMYAVRSGCAHSVIAADGLISVPNYAVGCICNYPVQTSFALYHLPEAGPWIRARTKLPPPKPN